MEIFLVITWLLNFQVKAEFNSGMLVKLEIKD
jgi:hypothetical protein